MAAILVALAGCNATDDDIEHWKHTQRGPGKITTVLVGTQYAEALRVHAARALIELKHPNYSGLELLQGALGQMADTDRDSLVHDLLPSLREMMNGPSDTVQGPTEVQIKAKDAAYVILRGDGHTSFASPEDRATLAAALLDWILVDFNTRALAGAYTAEQIVTAIGPSAADRLSAAIAGTETVIPVTVEIAKLINNVATPQGKQAAVARIIAVAHEVEGPGSNPRLQATARRMLTTANRPINNASVTSAADSLRGQYLLVLFEAIKTLGQPNGTEFLLAEAAQTASPLERRKAALSAVAGQVSAGNATPLMDIAMCTPGPTCDVELRGLAVDRLGETRDRGLIPRLFTMFEEANGSAADQGFSLRWKLGEAVIKLGGSAILPEFMQHLAEVRPAPFAGYTYAELNGEAQAIGDITPPPRDTMRAFVSPANAQPVRILAMMFLGIKGESADLPTLGQYTSDVTPVVGDAWGDVHLPTLGAVATRSREGLQQTLRQGQQALGTPAPTQPQ